MLPKLIITALTCCAALAAGAPGAQAQSAGAGPVGAGVSPSEANGCAVGAQLPVFGSNVRGTGVVACEVTPTTPASVTLTVCVDDGPPIIPWSPSCSSSSFTLQTVGVPFEDHTQERPCVFGKLYRTRAFATIRQGSLAPYSISDTSAPLAAAACQIHGLP